MKKEKKPIKNNNKDISEKHPVTSPIFQEKLVSKVNELTIKKRRTGNSVKLSYQAENHLDCRFVAEELVKLSEISCTNDLHQKIYSIINRSIRSDFLAIGLFKEKSDCINLRLNDKSGNLYTAKVFMKEAENPIVESFINKKIIYKENTDFLNWTYFKNNSTVIIPLISVKKCIGVMIVEDRCAKQNIELYKLIANYAALYIHNFELLENSSACGNIDNLTLLCNHRGFQELLANEISRAQTNKQKLSIIMMDICNITKINREFGHAKGDEVIKLVAEKVRQNIRENDIAGRYGGDEIAIILPNTPTEQAKYIAEYLTYSLSCCFMDAIGPVKVSVGISTYPDCSADREKLLILAEQAMYISQAKGYKDGMSAIISSADFNFWDDIALKSYAEVIGKRHAQLGVTFEDELISQFHADHETSGYGISEIAASLASAIDAKDPYTKGHSSSVSKFSEALARAVNLPEEDVERIKLGALLHDVGKIGIPETVLKKEGPLSDDEWEIMKQHPVIGAEKVLMPNPSLRDLIPVVKYHHERIDGKGYPDGLKGSEIPYAAKIVAVADTYHALISDRPYRRGMDMEKAVSILKDGAGTQWDKDLIRTFIQIAPSLGI